MDILGTVAMAIPAKRAIFAMHKADNLERMLGGQANVSALNATHYKIELKRDLGPVTLKLAIPLTFAPIVQGKTYKFVANAQHAVGGKADLDLVLTFEGDDAACTLTYAGTLVASGLMATTLYGREDRAKATLAQFFNEFKTRMERTQAIMNRKNGQVGV